MAISVLSLHHAFFQTYAWITMLNDRIPDQGIEQAFDTTFSGEYPCEKCKALAEQRQKEREQDPIPELNPTQKSPFCIAQTAEFTILLPSFIRLPYVKIQSRIPTDPYLALPAPPPRFC